jgi:hypothetical protein
VELFHVVEDYNACTASEIVAIVVFAAKFNGMVKVLGLLIVRILTAG